MAVSFSASCKMVAAVCLMVAVSSAWLPSVSAQGTGNITTPCNATTDCIQQLVCQDGVCKCNKTLIQFWDPVEEKCLGGYNGRCTDTDKGDDCMGQLVCTKEKTCQCGNTTEEFHVIDNVCYPNVGLMNTCTNSLDCVDPAGVNKFYFICKAKKDSVFAYDKTCDCIDGYDHDSKSHDDCVRDTSKEDDLKKKVNVVGGVLGALAGVLLIACGFLAFKVKKH